ncbi:hypothetical protein DID80_07870 [Candidatus Marinamargulisbacteria bacterium SCGC AAA071-K20]|nr:hypothetical protein DID80_07870 [Candidatus Marinamargulisbacteria bacterium SCGC AAA071-K20]
MTFKSAILVTFFILATSLNAAESHSTEFGINGKTWRKLPKGTQSLIISSYLKGVSAGYTTALIYSRELQQIEKIEFLQMMDNYSNVIPNKTLEEHHYNIDEFYSQKENKKKDLFQAIWFSVKTPSVLK